MKSEVVVIEKIVFGGDGLGRLSDGKVVFVPFTLPEEKVKIRIIAENRDYAEAQVEEILEPSPYRREPPCKYYFLCGGCQFQHIEYSEQLNIKKEILYDIFKRQGWKEEIPLEKVVSSPKEFGYRNRLRLHVEREHLKMGFVKRKSHEVLKIDHCLLGEDILNRVLKGLYENPAWIKFSFYTKRVKIESSPLENKAVLIFWTLLPPLKEDLRALFDIEELKCVCYWTRGSRPHGPYPEDTSFGGRRIFKSIDDMKYYVQPGVFVQTNWDINLAIMDLLQDLPLEYANVLDLHSGMGNFLFPLVKKDRADFFLGVDTDPRAIEDGIYIAEKEKINGRLDFRNISAMEALYEAVKYGEFYDLVILDPPRGGCKELMRLLPEVAKKYIIYISCDAPTLIRDIFELRARGYRLFKIYLFDMFPQTYHFETVALLEKI